MTRSGSIATLTRRSRTRAAARRRGSLPLAASSSDIVTSEGGRSRTLGDVMDSVTFRASSLDLFRR